MTTLKKSLENLISDFLFGCSIVHRSDDGYKLVFAHLIPTSRLDKLIAFCRRNKYHYYISAADSKIEFHIYK